MAKKKQNQEVNYDEILDLMKERAVERDKKANTDIYGLGTNMWMPEKEEDFVVGPEWWQTMSGVLGIPYGFIVQIAGTTDSGKTSAVIEFARKAQEQDVIVVWIDSERKTTKKRLTQWGVDPKKVILSQINTLEDMYESLDVTLEVLERKYPEKKILVIVDSLGNTPSETEREISIRESVQMGRRANVNNRGFSRIIPSLGKKIAVLVINQTYDNMGSPGKQNKGGKNKDFFSVIIFQTTRIGWIEGQVKGQKVRKGAKVKWNVYKHHLIDNEKFQGKVYELDITGKGISLKGEAPEEFAKLNEEDGVIFDEETGEILE